MTNADPDRLDWAALVAQGVALRESTDGAQWSLGDLAARVETTYGGNDLAQFADQIGVSFDSLDDYRRVARQFPDRSGNLPWTVYRVLTRVPDDRRAEALAAAQAGHWTVSRARQELKSYLPDETPSAAAQGAKKNLGMKASADPIVTRFRSIADAFEALKDDEEKEGAEPEQIARGLSSERRREVERAVQRATQFVDRWVSILEIDPSEGFEESAS